MRAVGGAAVSLLAIGAGAAVGLPGHHGQPGSLGVASGAARPTTTGISGGPSAAPATAATTVTTVDPSAMTASTVGAVPVAVGTGVPAGSGTGVGAVGATASGAADQGAGGTGGTGSPVVPVAGSAPGGSGSGPAQPAPAGPAAGGPGGSASGPGAAAPPLPATGNYTYATSGGSQITLLGSSTFPALTTVTVASRGCGDSFTWQSSPGNTQTTVECPVPGGVRILSESMTVTSHGYSDTQTFSCGPDSFVPVDSGAVGQTWQWSCTSTGGEVATQVVRLLGHQTVLVGGVPVSTEQVSVDSTLTGAEKGTIASTYWLASNALPVRETGTADVTADGFAYQSQYTLQLSSLRPS